MSAKTWTVAAAAWAWSSVALAADGNQVLAQVDAALSRFTDQYIKFDVTHQDPGASTQRKMQFQTRVKGQKTLTEFLAPGDMKGTRVLIMSRSEMYVYAPAYGKVRRIASHLTEAGFQGSAYSQEEMSTYAWSPVYSASVASETSTSYVLSLTVKPGVEAAFGNGRLTVSKDKYLPSKIEWLAADGSVAKTEIRDEYKCSGNACTPGHMKMTDHRRGCWTELRVADWKVNTGISDSIFSTRELMMGSQ